MATESNLQPEDITKFSASVKADGVEYDVSYHISQLEIYQSIFSPSIVCRMEVNDRTNMLSKAPLNGREKWTIAFNSVNSNSPTNLILYPLRIETITPRPDLQGQHYLIVCGSRESFVDLNTYVQKSYKAQISSVVQDIYSNFFQTTKRVSVEETAGSPALIIPNITAFQALTFLKRRAVSATYRSSAFVSFESLEGFNFVCLESLIAKKEVYQYTLGHSSVLNADAITKAFVLTGYKHIRKFDIQDLLMAGGLGSTVEEYNIKSKSLTSVSIGLDNKASGWAVLNQKRANEGISSQFPGGPPSYLKFYDPDRGEPQESLHLGERISFISDLLQNQLEIDIPGNTGVNAGDVIFLRVGDFSVRPESRPKEIHSGRYLVADALHTISNGVKLTTKLTLFKESLT